MKRQLLPRILALVAVVLFGGYYILVDVLHLGGASSYSVTLKLPRGGGIYTSADVTYRGVPVGTVRSVDVTTTGVDVTLQLDEGTTIPADVDADVRQLSAIGEQYVDLVPASSRGRLSGGSVIPVDRAHVPVPIGTALNSLGSLLDSLDEKDLSTVESFLTTGFTGTDEDLRTLVVQSQQLLRSLQAAQPQTAALITDGTPVLTTLGATNQQLAQYTANLNQLSAQFKASDADLRALLTKGGPATDQLAGLLARTRDDLAGTIAGIGSGSQAFLQHQPQSQALFELLPLVATDLRDVTAGGVLRSKLTLNAGQRTVCSYLSAGAFPLPEQVTSTVDMNNACSRTASDLLKRGAATAPGPAVP